MMRRKIGAHVSTAGGYHLAAEKAHEIGANCAQIFSSSPRVWSCNWESKFKPDLYFAAMKDYDISPVFTHALYLINLASKNPEQVKKSVTALKQELEFISAIRGAGVIFHLGSHMGNGWDAVREQVAAALSEILADTPEDSILLIENSAGQNGKVCSNLSEIRWLLDTVKSDRLGWCFDTCHAFAAGYSLGEAEQSGAEHPKYVGERAFALEAIDALELWPSLKCIHVNDSQGALASGTDRHANLLEGQIPEADFRHFLNHEKTRDLPLILEVPGEDKQGPDAANIAKLKQLTGEE